MAPSTRTTAPSKSADNEGAENASSAEALLVHSRAAAAVYHSAFGAFCRSTTPKEFEVAMDTLEAAQMAEQEARRADMGRMVAAITARCEYILEQNPQSDAWWAIVGLGVDMEGATVRFVREFEEEREARCHDLFRAAEAKVQEGLLNEDPWECPPIVARIFDNSGGESFDL